MARRKALIPVPASSGSPSDRTSPPRRPVLSAWSKLDTAALNWGELRWNENLISNKKENKKSNKTHCTMRCRTWSEGGIGRSGGRWGKRAGTKFGWSLNSGKRFAGVSMSVRDKSATRINNSLKRELRETRREDTNLLLVALYLRCSCFSAWFVALRAALEWLQN